MIYDLSFERIQSTVLSTCNYVRPDQILHERLADHVLDSWMLVWYIGWIGTSVLMSRQHGAIHKRAVRTNVACSAGSMQSCPAVLATEETQ